MKLVAKIKLLPTNAQRAALLATVERMNSACNWLAAKASEARIFKQYDLHALHYRDLRNQFDLSAQAAVRAIAKVAHAFKINEAKEFRSHGAVPYDARIYSFKKSNALSILTLNGREIIPFIAAGPHAAYLSGKCGEADLVLRKGRWYLHVSVEAKELIPFTPVHFLGVDLGAVNLATDSDGVQYSGAAVEKVRLRTLALRTALQQCGTRSARRHLKRISGREARFRANTNHVISKRLVRKAKDTRRAIVVEDLHGIRDRLTVRKAQRARLGSWAFFQMRTFITYKAALSGVTLISVDPRDTSRRCISCKYTDKANRKSQAEFVCHQCGYAANADYIGAVNIARKAVTAHWDFSKATVRWPIVSSVDAKIPKRSGFRGAQKQASASPALG